MLTKLIGLGLIVFGIYSLTSLSNSTKIFPSTAGMFITIGLISIFVGIVLLML